MINVVLIGGELNDKMGKALDKKEFNLVRTYEDVERLWEDLLENGGTGFMDVDRVLILPPGMLPSKRYNETDQLLNVQSAFSIEGIRSVLHFMTKDADLFKTMKDGKNDYVMFRNFHMVCFDNLTIKDISTLLKGGFDSQGLSHDDFARRKEIDDSLDRELGKEDEVVEDVVVREDFDGFADKKEAEKALREAEKLAKEKELAERKASREERRKTEKSGGFPKLFGKKDKSDVVVAPPIPKVEKPKKEKPKKEKAKKSSARAKQDVELKKGIIAVTGDRQSGVSTTVANMAEVHARHGHSVLILDLDVKRRFQTKIFPKFNEAIAIETRVSHGLLVSLLSSHNVEDVAAVVSDNIALLSIADDVDRVIRKFANRPFEQVFSAGNLVNLLSFAKSMFDVVLVDLPFENLKRVGNMLSYVDNVVLCVPNTMYHIDNLLEIEADELALLDEVVMRTLLTKSKIVLTKFNSSSTYEGKQVNEEFVMDTLSLLEDSMYHIEVVGRIPYDENYEGQVGKGKVVVNADSEMRENFESFMGMI